MIVFAKRSGESLNAHAPKGKPYSAVDINATVADVAAFYQYITAENPQGIRGAALVMGAGNLAMRGENLVEYGLDKDTADIIGMGATMQNAFVVHRALSRTQNPKVKSRLFVPETVDHRSDSMDERDKPEWGTPGRLQMAFDDQELAVFGYGSDRKGQTTDAAVLDHAIAYHWETGEEVTVLKGTKHCVHDANPTENPNARPLAIVSADRMQQERWTVVDDTCLELVQEHGITVRVHTLEVPLVEAVGGSVGTLIVPQSGVLQYA